MPTDINLIRGLAEIAQKFGLTEICITNDGADITIKRENGAAEKQAAPAPVQIDAESAAIGEELFDFGDVAAVKSPMVGMFYTSPAPGEPPYAPIGSHIKKGSILCVIEAMKLLNEVRAERDCEIVDVCAENGAIVEFGQTIFKIV